MQKREVQARGVNSLLRRGLGFLKRKAELNFFKVHFFKYLHPPADEEGTPFAFCFAFQFHGKPGEAPPVDSIVFLCPQGLQGIVPEWGRKQREVVMPIGQKVWNENGPILKRNSLPERGFLWNGRGIP